MIFKLGHCFDQKKMHKKVHGAFFWCKANRFSVKLMRDRKSLFSIFIFEQKVFQSSNLVCSFTVIFSFGKLIFQKLLRLKNK